MSVGLQTIQVLAQSVKVQFNLHMANEQVLTRQDVPDRAGWALESILAGVEKISVVVRNVHTGSGFQIAAFSEGKLTFSRSMPTPECISDAQILASATLKKIDEKDTTNWPRWSSLEEAKKEFWKDYVESLPNILHVAEVLMT